MSTCGTLRCTSRRGMPPGNSAASCRSAPRAGCRSCGESAPCSAEYPPGAAPRSQARHSSRRLTSGPAVKGLILRAAHKNCLLRLRLPNNRSVHSYHLPVKAITRGMISLPVYHVGNVPVVEVRSLYLSHTTSYPTSCTSGIRITPLWAFSPSSAVSFGILQPKLQASVNSAPFAPSRSKSRSAA